MSSVSSKFQSQGLKTQQSLNYCDDNGSKEGLFVCAKDKQTIINRLKKGNLFRMSHYLKPDQKNIMVEDTFLVWLQENPPEKNSKRKSQEIGQDLNQLLKQEPIKKQKKSQNTKLPKIRLFASTQKLSVLSKFQKEKDKKLTEIRGINNFENRKEKLNQQKKNQYNELNYYTIKNSSPLHRQLCYRNNLNKTQLFKSNENVISDQEILKNIRNNFYLNDHKKLLSTSTFFMKQKTQEEIDFDLRRLKGFSRSSAKSFEENLQKLDKKAILTFYNELSHNFSSMKKQIETLILQNFEKDTKKRSKNYQKKDQINEAKSRFSTRIKTEQNYLENENKDLQQCYLPKFLMKSLILPQKRCNSQHLNEKIIQNLRT